MPTLLLLYIIRAKRRRQPGADFSFLCKAVTAYCGIYLLTPAPLDWQLETSLSRLLHQRMPSVLLVCGTELAHARVHAAEQH